MANSDRIAVTKDDRQKCKGPTCGKQILYAVDETGKRIPLDPVPAVYMIWKEGDIVRCKRLDHAAVTHFATCPDAGGFSKKTKPA